MNGGGFHVDQAFEALRCKAALAAEGSDCEPAQRKRQARRAMTTRGAQAEALAETYLVRKGLAVLARNFRVRGGEVDLICRDGATLVFVEVRLRSSARYGGAAASITAAKRQRIVLAAQHFLAGKPLPACRFDCVLLDALDADRVEWIRDAFSAG